jgi:hypothetical protein
VQVPVSPVSFVVAVIAPCVVLRALSSCRIGVAVAVVVPHSVLRLLSLCCTWGRSRGRMPHVVLQSRSLCCVGVAGAVVRLHGVVVVVTVVVPRVGRRRHLCAACGVAVAVVAPCVVSRSRSLRHVWCCGRGRCAMCGVAVAVVALHGCRGCRRCATCGAAVAVVTLHMASRARLSGCVVSWSWSRSLRRVWVMVAVFVLCVGCGHHLCAACGVAVVVIAPCVVSRLRLLCCVWCRGCSHCATCGVTVAVVAPRVVSRSQSLRRVWCRGRSRCAVCGVAVGVIAPRVGHGRCLWAMWVSRSWSSWWLSSCRMVPQLWSLSSRHHWTTKEEVSRKKKKEKRKHTSRPMRCVQPRRDKRMGHIYISHKII